MTTAKLIIALWIVAPFAIISTICAIRFFFMNLRKDKENKSLKEQLEKRNITSICQGIEIEMLTTDRKALNQEIIDHMLEDYDHELLISFET